MSKVINGGHILPKLSTKEPMPNPCRFTANALRLWSSGSQTASRMFGIRMNCGPTYALRGITVSIKKGKITQPFEANGCSYGSLSIWRWSQHVNFLFCLDVMT